MMRLLGKTIVILAMFALCFFIARSLTGKWVSFPHLVKEIKQLLSGQATLLVSPPQQSLPLVQDIGSWLEENHSLIHGCNIEDRTPVTEKQGPRVYRWRDDKGRWVFSDTPEENRSVEAVPLPSTGKDYFGLKVSYPAGHVPADIKQSLEISGRGLYQVYKTYLGLENLSRADIDVQVFGDSSAYERLKTAMAPNLAANTPGFYSSRENQAVVLHQDSGEQTRRTAIHESAHVINANLFGFTPSWFNEGMAEYFENIKLSGQLIEIQPDHHWLQSEHLLSGPMPVAELLNAEDTLWSGEDRSRYYANSWALVFFMMEENQKDIMVDWMLAMSKNRCQPKSSVAFFSKNYPGGLAALDREWQQWHKNAAKRPHRL